MPRFLKLPRGHSVVTAKVLETETIALADLEFDVDETVEAVYIYRIHWSGQWTITRAAEVVWTTPGGTGMLDLHNRNLLSQHDKGDSIVITRDGADGVLYLELKKEVERTPFGPADSH